MLILNFTLRPGLGNDINMNWNRCSFESVGLPLRYTFYLITTECHCPVKLDAERLTNRALEPEPERLR